MNKFCLRGFTSLVLSIAFAIVLCSGLVLWLTHSPQTLGIGRGVWKETHIHVSLLLAVAAVLHFALNWPVYWSYIWQRAGRRLNQKLELALAVAVTAVVVWTASLGGDPMQRMAAMSLTDIAQKSGQSVEQIVAALDKEGIHVDNPADSLRAIAEHNKVNTRMVGEIVNRAARGGGPPSERR